MLKYTKARRSVKLLYVEFSCDRCSSTNREYEIKKLQLIEKILIYIKGI
jgi:predicted GIY-YIG superfamily endonuclease